MSSSSSSATKTSSSVSLSRPPKSPILSSGRGGAGNKRPKSGLKLDLGDDPEILQKRRLEASLNPRVKVKYTGRGGTGNIRAASHAQTVPFDISADPDDDYEQIVLQIAQKAKKDKTPSTGRGGLGNLNRPRSKSAIATSAAPKGKQGKSRRKYSFSSSRYSSSSSEQYELRRITTDTGSLSLDITASRLTPESTTSSPLRLTQSASGYSSLPNSPTSAPSALYLLWHKASTTSSLPSPSIRISRSKSPSGVSPRQPVPGATSAPNSPLRPNPHTTSGLPLLPLPACATESMQNTLNPPTLQATGSNSSLPDRASTPTLGLPSPPASPISLKATVTEPTRALISHKLQKSRNQETPSKWWKISGRRRVKEGVVPPMDMVPDETLASSSEESPAVKHADLQSAPCEAMAHLQEVGMHAMEVRIRMREERLVINRTSQRSPPLQPQEFDDPIQHGLNDDEVSCDRNDSHQLPPVPEEDDIEYVSFLEFN